MVASVRGNVDATMMFSVFFSATAAATLGGFASLKGAGTGRRQGISDVEVAAGFAVFEIPHQRGGVQVGNGRDAQASHSYFDSTK